MHLKTTDPTSIFSIQFSRSRSSWGKILLTFITRKIAGFYSMQFIKEPCMEMPQEQVIHILWPKLFSSFSYITTNFNPVECQSHTKIIHKQQPHRHWISKNFLKMIVYYRHFMHTHGERKKSACLLYELWTQSVHFSAHSRWHWIQKL